ncbi:hypothetical protein KOR34_45430 [Posidoniimonas corsicana]|uniref:Uncharacterized protein n=2 Tax=Posidoniimonas corsicana TaxID=1938618 RepID=A0A5C5V075_9BACT|nr:hypothetical protein KOR34_45430 [Posidoniimonas corsicana]
MSVRYDTDSCLVNRHLASWWESHHDQFFKLLHGVSSALDAVRFFDGEPPYGDFERLAIAVDLWLDEAEERISGTARVLYQHEFEKLGLGFMAYADSLGISTTAIWELYALLTAEGAGEDEDGDPIDLPNLSPPRRKADRLFVTARGELTRIELAHGMEWELEHPELDPLYTPPDPISDSEATTTEPAGAGEQKPSPKSPPAKRPMQAAGKSRGRPKSKAVAARRDDVKYQWENVTKTPRVIADKLRSKYPTIQTYTVHGDLKALGLKGTTTRRKNKSAQE